MNSKITLFTILVCTILLSSCTKDSFNERDAIEAQKELLNLKYQHELDLETLKQKGATALQQLINSAALEQVKLNDSLAAASAVNARKQDYSIVVVDAVSNTPIADADVTVSSQGKAYAAKTNAQGVVSFTALYLFPTSSFMISKTGYAATQIQAQNVAYGTAKLWNATELTNEISGVLYIETDLTNTRPEKVGANVLVTASTTIPVNNAGSYSVYYPTYTTAEGSYAIQLPAAPNGYSLSFSQVTAEQKLFVNGIEDDAATTFPASLPRATMVTTYFNVNSFNANIPSVMNSYYFKVAPDKNGKVLFIPGYVTNYGYNTVVVSGVSDKYQVERLFTYYYTNYPYSAIDFNSYTYDPGVKVDIEMVDVTGNLIQTAPLLTGQTNASGKLMSYNSPESGSGYIHLRRDNAGVLLPNAKGSINRATNYDQYNNLYSLSFNSSLNTTTNRSVGTGYLLMNKGDKKVVNFYYGAGDSRTKQVY